MAQVIATDVTLIRGTFNITIATVVYSMVDIKRSAKAKVDEDYTTAGKYRGSSQAEQAETISTTIRARSDQVAPPKFVVFAFDSLNWYIRDRELSGSQTGIQQYAVDIVECPSGVVTIS